MKTNCERERNELVIELFPTVIEYHSHAFYQF